MRIARGAGEAGKVDFAPGGDRVAAVGLVAAVDADEMDEVLGRSVRDGGQRTEVHQEAAVAVERQYLLVRQAEREAERVRRCLAHGAHRQEIERARRSA